VKPVSRRFFGTSILTLTHFTNTTTNGSALWCSSSYPNGCGGNESWYNISDFRLTDAVTNLPTARGPNSVMKLRRVTYHWKDKKLDQSEHIGLIAQEVEPVYPEVVGSGPGRMESMAYSDLLVPLMLSAVSDRARILDQAARSIGGRQARVSGSAIHRLCAW
jgi:Chaperone of endosialidase